MDIPLDLYIRPDAFILVPVLYFIGLFLRQTPRIPNWSYVWIELMFAVIACLLYFGLEIQSVLQGILVTGVAFVSRDVIHHMIGGLIGKRKNLKKKKNGDKKDSK